MGQGGFSEIFYLGRPESLNLRADLGINGRFPEYDVIRGTGAWGTVSLEILDLEEK